MIAAIVGVYGWIAINHDPIASACLAVLVSTFAVLWVDSYFRVTAILRKEREWLPFITRGYIAVLMVFPFLIRFLHPNFARQTDFISEFLHSKAH